MRKFKLLIFSVGSLLGECVLDVLEGRRAEIDVLGLNSVAANPCLFRTDRVYLMPELAQEQAFTDRLLGILSREQPDLILPGRDEDVLFLAEFRQRYPVYAAAIPCGLPEAVHIVYDKYLCWEWAQAQGLPFARSFLLTSASQSQLPDFLAKAPFPLIAKPRTGFGSQGVCYVLHAQGLAQLAGTGPVLLQEYLGSAQELLAAEAQFARQFCGNLPLFYQTPETRQFAAQTLIGPDGSHGPVFCSQSTLVMGRTEAFRQRVIPELTDLMLAYVQALKAIGWCGSVNLQARPDAAGVWKAFELNLRMTGGTSSRLHLGFDEFGQLMQAFYPDWTFPLVTQAKGSGAVLRRLTDHFVDDALISQLEATGCWDRVPLPSCAEPPVPGAEPPGAASAGNGGH